VGFVGRVGCVGNFRDPDATHDPYDPLLFADGTVHPANGAAGSGPPSPQASAGKQDPAYSGAEEMTAIVSRVAPMTALKGMPASNVARYPPIFFASPSRYISLT
jgi:hypothetical protein